MKKIIFLFIASVILCGWGVNASVAGDSVQYEVVTVDENDTLWDIAARRIDNTRIFERRYTGLNSLIIFQIRVPWSRV